MEIVAQHLQREAIRRNGIVEERDFFGRSAFNRYYYATFLEVKTGLGRLNPVWGTISHASVPELLEGSIKDEFKKGQKKAMKLRDGEVIGLCAKAISATNDLAKLMREGYMSRVTADYHPEIKVEFQGPNRFELNAVPVQNASDWLYRARPLIKTIVTTWMQLHE